MIISMDKDDDNRNNDKKPQQVTWDLTSHSGQINVVACESEYGTYITGGTGMYCFHSEKDVPISWEYYFG